MAATADPIDLTHDDDGSDPRQPKRIRTEDGARPSPQPYGGPALSNTFPAASYSSYNPNASIQSQTFSPASAYPASSPWSPQGVPPSYHTNGAPSVHLAYPMNSQYPPAGGLSGASTPNGSQKSLFPAGQYSPYPPPTPTAVFGASNGMSQPYGAMQPASYSPQVIDLTGRTPGPTAPSAKPAAPAPAAVKDVRRDVVCIGQISATALILYPVQYVCTGAPAPNDKPQAPLQFPNDEFVPVRLRYDDPSKKRFRVPNTANEETIAILVPPYKISTPDGQVTPYGGEEFGVVEQRVASVLGPLMAKVLIRMEAKVRREYGAATVPMVKLRILVFTPRGNIKVVSSYLSQGGLRLEHPTVQYDPSQHRDSPPYENPHLTGGTALMNTPTFPSAMQNRWTNQTVSGKSVEVQRSQVDEVFKSLRSGDDLTETEGGLNVATNLYPHQKIALTFLLEREKEKPAPHGGWLWQPRKDRDGNVRSWFHPVTGKETNKEPPQDKGGILADDMGLGKTISIVSLMGNTLDSAKVFAYGPMKKIMLKVAKTAPEPPLTAANFAAQVWGMPETAGSIDSLAELEASTSENGKKGKRETQKELTDAARAARIKVKSRATLIVCPLSTIANWEEQFREHWGGEVTVVGGNSGAPPGMSAPFARKASSEEPRRGKPIKLYVYHGAARRPDVNFLADFDAVITTYSTLATEFSKQVKSSESYEDPGEGDDNDSGSDGFSDDLEARQFIKIKEKKPKKRPPGAALAAGVEVSSPLQQIHWFRIVLDEAHSIKETSTIASRACCDLMGERRWALTGTPVQNKLDDVYALIKFLRVHPFDDKAIWSEYIGGPAKFGQPLGVARLQTIMKSITLRRTKDQKDDAGKQILNLPPRHDEVRYLKFDEQEQSVYDSYFTESKAEFTHLRKVGEVMKNYVGILQKILRLRQICDHYELVKGKDEGPEANQVNMDYDQIMSSIMREGMTLMSATAIFNLLRDAGTAQCVECGQDLTTGGNLLDGTELDVPKKKLPKAGGKGGKGAVRATSPTGSRPVITKCQHLFCIECFRLSVMPNWPKIKPGPGMALDEVVHKSCSVCQADLAVLTDAIEVNPDGSLNDATRTRPLKKEKREKGSALAGYNASTKVKALMGDLMEISKQNPYSPNYDPSVAASADVQMVDAKGNRIEDITKTIVFSQWTSMLDKIEDALEEGGIGYQRLDGTMKREERTMSMESLKTDPRTEVLLVSLRAGGVGLNLTAARRVYLMDPYWNPAVENQAVDRIHRLGQRNPVNTIKMIMEGSIEERLLAVQAKKTELANMTLGQPLSKQEMQQRRMEELNTLFD